MKKLYTLLSSIILVALINGCTTAVPQKDTVTIVSNPNWSAPEKVAANELKTYLTKLYTDTAFIIAEPNPQSLAHLYIGSRKTLSDKFKGNLVGQLNGPESYVVAHRTIDGQPTGIILGEDPAGAIYGVYDLLEKLGCGFYLSFDHTPAPQTSFTLDPWVLANKPLVDTRLVFNWHNFLSGCSGWNVEEWKQWITQSQKMKYNTIMVHAYGNNPMFNFSYKGREKEAGYIPNTARGRDWGTQHANDVRRLIGGELFTDPVWGADYSRVPEDQVKSATVDTMQKVFAYAEERAVDVVFTFDLITKTSTPADLTDLLPDEAKLTSAKGMVFANPETEAGYDYYKSQIRWLVETYPEIDVIAPWVRMFNITKKGNDLTLKKMPKEWKAQYRQIIKTVDKEHDHPFSEGVFVFAKIMKAYQRAIDEVGQGQVRLATGTWNWESFTLFDIFLDDHIDFFPIDSKINFDSDQTKETLQHIKPERGVYPIVWANHDDHAYVGTSYVPYENFMDQLNERQAEGFGIIHWTTRPLDIYFKSLAKQVWNQTVNQPNAKTISTFCTHTFGSTDPLFQHYITDWLNDGPIFGRVTTDYFFDTHPSRKKPDHLLFCKEESQQATVRLSKLNEFDASNLSPTGQEWMAYFKGSETFYSCYLKAQAILIKAQQAINKNEYKTARTLMASSRENEAIQAFADFVQRAGGNRGEEALVISLNLRWRPDFLSIKQQLGLEPYLINFAPTQHEPLAQWPGNNTFHTFNDGQIALVIDNEIDGAIGVLHGDQTGGLNTMFNSHIESDEELNFTIGALRRYSNTYVKLLLKNELLAGEYRIETWFKNPDANQPCTFDLEITDNAGKIIQQERIDLTGKNAQKSIKKTVTTQLEKGTLNLRLVPIKGKAMINGMVIEKL